MNLDSIVLFVIALSAVLSVAGLAIAGFLSPGFEFWPPPRTPSWQQGTLRSLFRVYVVCLVLLSFVDFNNTADASWRFAVGIPLVVIGFGLAILWSSQLGWRNAYGAANGLKIDGIFRWSRNPIYVVSFIALFGWALTVAAWSVTTLLVVWALMYIGGPFLEEPWLEKQYGQAYASYKSRVPRFIGFRRHANTA